MVFISKKFFFVTNLLLPMLQLFHLLLVIQHHQQKSKREKIFMKLFFLVLKNLKQFKYYLFLNHSKFLIHRLEVESVESRSIKENFEISESDFSNLLTDAWHERSDWTVGKVQNFSGSGWSCWSWNKNQSWFEDNLAIFMIWHEMMISSAVLDGCIIRIQFCNLCLTNLSYNWIKMVFWSDSMNFTNPLKICVLTKVIHIQDMISLEYFL